MSVERIRGNTHISRYQEKKGRLPKKMKGKLIAIEELTGEDGDSTYRLKLSSGVAIVLPAPSDMTVSHFKLGDRFLIIPLELNLGKKKKISPDSKKVLITRNKEPVPGSGLPILNEWIELSK